MTLLVFADWDDPDLSPLRSIVQQQVPTAWISLGLDDSHYDLVATDSAFSFRSHEVSISDATVAMTTAVIYRRWRQHHSTLVRSRIDVPAHRAFAEREWADAVSAVLSLVERNLSAAVRWSQRPSDELLAATRISLLLRAKALGVPVVAWTIASTSKAITKLAGPHVMKALNRDERVDSELLLGTTPVSLAEVSDALRRAPKTPVYLQRRLERREELRIIHVFGRCVTVSLTPHRAVVDIRDLPLNQLSVKSVACPSGLATAIAHYCHAMHFGLCVFDAIRDAEEWSIVDITPNGGWAYLESESDRWLSEQIVQAVVAEAQSHQAMVE